VCGGANSAQPILEGDHRGVSFGYG
jgi:hypothetical protein